MPLVKPKNKEKKTEFVSRCIGDTQTNKDFPDQKQRIAVCYSQWEKAKAEASVIAGEGDSEFLYSYGSSIENEDGVEVLDEAEAKEAQKKLNKPFRTPGGPKKFSVYVKNEKGNIVKVNFGDPNMEIKRDDPERRKSYRARHNCDNPGPKWKANYWSCKMWSAKPVSAIASEDEMPEEELMDLKEDLSEMVIGSLGAVKSLSENILNNLSSESVKENLSEPFLQQMAALAEDYVTTIHNYVMFSQEPEVMEEADAAKRKGLWDNIRNKKKRMGKNYKPARPGSPDRPSENSWKKAQE
jgi:predicted metal-binding transcription factor (methanogenesis marker protein 9)